MTSSRVWLLIWYVPVIVFRFFYGAVEGARMEVEEFKSDWKAGWEKQ
jgi:hypothetical protein